MLGAAMARRAVSAEQRAYYRAHIPEAVREDGLPTAEIAARTGLAARSVTKQLQRLGQRGVTVAPPRLPVRTRSTACRTRRCWR